MNAQMLFIVCFSASLAAVGIEILKKLGLEDGAGAGDILIALAQYLVKALVDEVVKMLPSTARPAKALKPLRRKQPTRNARSVKVTCSRKSRSSLLAWMRSRSAPHRRQSPLLSVLLRLLRV